jgi:hypothetical protein
MTPDTDSLTDGERDATAVTTDESYDVPNGVSAVECGYCGRPFADDDLLALHRGVDHGNRLDEEERAAFAAAVEREDDALRLYRLKAVGIIVALYFGLLMTYALVG